jgi:hypothetical protein
MMFDRSCKQFNRLLIVRVTEKDNGKGNNCNSGSVSDGVEPWIAAMLFSETCNTNNCPAGAIRSDTP